MDKTQATSALSALSQSTRLDVFRFLVKAGHDGVPAGTIAQALAVRQNTMSTHLAILARAGLIQSRRNGRTIRYSADFPGMRGLLAFLMEDCCQGKTAICSPWIDTMADRC